LVEELGARCANVGPGVGQHLDDVRSIQRVYDYLDPRRWFDSIGFDRPDRSDPYWPEHFSALTSNLLRVRL